jgi:hypothetical protein
MDDFGRQFPYPRYLTVPFIFVPDGNDGCPELAQFKRDYPGWVTFRATFTPTSTPILEPAPQPELAVLEKPAAESEPVKQSGPDARPRPEHLRQIPPATISSGSRPTGPHHRSAAPPPVPFPWPVPPPRRPISMTGETDDPSQKQGVGLRVDGMTPDEFASLLQTSDRYRKHSDSEFPREAERAARDATETGATRGRSPSRLAAAATASTTGAEFFAEAAEGAGFAIEAGAAVMAPEVVIPVLLTAGGAATAVVVAKGAASAIQAESHCPYTPALMPGLVFHGFRPPKPSPPLPGLVPPSLQKKKPGEGGFTPPPSKPLPGFTPAPPTAAVHPGRPPEENKPVVVEARLPQDTRVNPTAPDLRATTRPVGKSATQNARAQADIAKALAKDAEDVTVNQHQVNASGQRVGVNRPDVQYTDRNGKRVYIEYDKPGSPRGQGHRNRIRENDPNGKIISKTVR